MKVKMYYDAEQLKAAVAFISANNPAFPGEDDYIRKRIFQTIDELVNDWPAYYVKATMGFSVWGTMDMEEGIDSEENILQIEILVDPAAGILGEYVCEIVEKKIV